MRVHVIQTGSLEGNATFMRGDGWGSLLRKRSPFTFPAYCFILEHDDGHVAIDTGMTAKASTPRALRRMVPTPSVTPEEEVGPAMRRIGLRPEDVRLVIVTHLDWDHFGGVGHFPDARVLVHRPEWEFAKRLPGRLRYQPRLWPRGLSPELYELDPEPYGPFPHSRPVTDAGDVRLVPIPGHSVAQVGVVVSGDGPTLLFGADHMLRQDWFLADYAAGRLKNLGVFHPKAAVETSRRIHDFLAWTPTVLLPSHDAEVAQRLAAREPIRV